MTLNITLATKLAIHQSADFRLVDATSGNLVSDSSPKQILLLYRGWHGLVTYAGVGRVGGVDTSGWLSETLSRKLGQEPTLNDVVECLRIQGSAWLGRIRPRLHHTFVVAAFAEGNPHIILVSNFQEVDPVTGRVATEALYNDGLRVSQFKPTRHIVSSGSGSVAVPPLKRQVLRQVERRKADSVHAHATRALLAHMNTMASQRDPNVSIGCACYTITHDKKGWGELWGDVEGHYYPMVIQRGTVVSSQIEQVAMRTALSGEWEKGHRALQDGRFIQQKQATSGSSENDEVQLYAVEVGVTDDPDDTI